MGKSYELAKTLEKGDTFTIVSGLIGKRKYEDNWYDDVVIFEIDDISQGKREETVNKDEFEEDDTLPF